MADKKPWTDLEMFVLIRSTKEILPEIATAMERPLEEVFNKYEQLQTIFEKEYEDQAQNYIRMGFEPDEAFLKVADEVKIDLKKIRMMEK
ncbi:MAG: hypothetical protein ACFFCW_47410 [Candidatus Hodarchaeota archaeon]